MTEDKNLAVIAKEKIKRLTKFGPYCGMTKGKKPINSDLYWQVPLKVIFKFFLYTNKYLNLE